MGRNKTCCGEKNKPILLPGSLRLLLPVHSRSVVHNRRTTFTKKRERSVRGTMTKRKGGIYAYDRKLHDGK